ncbi:MAG: RluA family pseudouridine synthase [Zymomonas mobilis subsp. pomaceae]|uniref:Pseudouridine synthase n=1 Tax=Zymomonas mobilis subsp. pomaceae (strain ATCC 29192 / DSM 22645 / JCM 10191 / CCUG 17912 / NBRC 13757 / NCIMB 11200 / NRRL B-4491 / Barker I) TaxID=579138 RepID=F8ES98_ZYMMT|nr:RluA family pseudouridine synthase [Zymomonas mobilis]AEI37673.1 pseudouridine synthase, RluA family [Zymomonas mobilis subsp. pomaceae ATCC 29192]MDX5949041.1 RluA family pseudouridine synthase [Zymomonas mobilis subsp. pomaceae]GEB88846.1 pseudouridine synthase [Zymomonas mobilis subsp. pomaceae]
MSENVRSFIVDEDDDGIRLDRWFQRHLPDTGYTRIARWARTGQLRLDGRRALPGARVMAGQSIRVPPIEPDQSDDRPSKPKRAELTAAENEFAQSLVIHRDRDAIIVNKPPGLATQGGTKTHYHLDGLLDALQFDAVSRPKLVHRLDKDTSGVLLLARSANAAGYFSKSFSGRTAHKVYWALVVGVPSIEEGLIDLPLARQPGSGGEKMHVDEENGATAKTLYRIVERAGNAACWLELQPLTGRTHQLRAHLSAIGFPIVGDGKYGGKEAFLTGGISRKMHLHARRLVIPHPNGSSLDVHADLPEHFIESMGLLGFDLENGFDRPLAGEKIALDKESEKIAAGRRARDRRRARRGERRNRSSQKEHDKKR